MPACQFTSMDAKQSQHPVTKVKTGFTVLPYLHNTDWIKTYCIVSQQNILRFSGLYNPFLWYDTYYANVSFAKQTLGL